MMSVVDMVQRAQEHYVLAATTRGMQSSSMPDVGQELLINHNQEQGDKWMVMARILQREEDKLAGVPSDLAGVQNELAACKDGLRFVLQWIDESILQSPSDLDPEVITSLKGTIQQLKERLVV